MSTESSIATTGFDDALRATLAGLADVLIPAGAGMPSASEAGVAHDQLDKVLAARPDLAEPLARVVRGGRGRDPQEYVDGLLADDKEAFSVLAEVVPGGYYLNDEVRERVGYHGQTPKPIDPDAPPDYADLLPSVVERGPIYRPTP